MDARADQAGATSAVRPGDWELGAALGGSIAMLGGLAIGLATGDGLTERQAIAVAVTALFSLLVFSRYLARQEPGPDTRRPQHARGPEFVRIAAVSAGYWAAAIAVMTVVGGGTLVFSSIVWIPFAAGYFGAAVLRRRAAASFRAAAR
jgi:hypothetical protein